MVASLVVQAWAHRREAEISVRFESAADFASPATNGTRFAGTRADAMDLAERATAFLILHESADFCDACLGRALGIDADVARDIAAALAKSAAMLRDRWTCRSCGASTVVTRAIPSMTFALGHRSRARLRRSA